MSGMKLGFVISRILLVLILMVAGSSSAGIPKKINYQGKITDSVTGNPLAGTHNMTFRIYDDPSTGSLLWIESQTLAVDSTGIFSAILGSITPIDTSFDGPVWLEVGVGGETLSPRREIVSVPFAFRAEEAEHADGADSLGGYISEDFIRDGEIAVITSEMIIDGTGSDLDADMVDGLNADAFADTGHVHDDRYYTQDSLSTPGAVNGGSNPVDWTKLKGVPAGFADGLDDVGGAGDGHSLDAADGDPVDAVYVDNDGNVGIGKAPSAEQLDVDGSINLSEQLKIGGTTVLSVEGDGNTLVGADAGMNTTGHSNTFVGTSAGLNNGTGTENVFVGDSAGVSNTEGYYNVFVGNVAGFANTDGFLNSFIGSGAGAANDEGGWNTFVGALAGVKNIDANSNTFIGMAAGAGNTSGSDNVYAGRGAGGINSTGSDNTCLGSYTGPNGNGSRNVFIGHMAGSNETGSDKLYIANGPDPGNALIYGDFATGNVGVGTTSPSSKLDVAGSLNLADVLKIGGSTVLGASASNTFVGVEAGNSSVSGPSNTFVGATAGRANTSGGSNTFVGLHAGVNNTSAWQNTFVGAGAGRGNITGANCAFVGMDAGSNNTTGHENSFLGCFAGFMNEGASDNTCVGARSGQSNRTGHSNTFLGKESGYMDSTGSSNTFVGKAAGWSTTSGSGSVFLGHEAGYSETGSNRLYIANGRDPENVLVYGDFATGRIGLGTLSPDRKLHIVGDNPRILIEAASGSPEVNLKQSGDPPAEVWAIYKHGVEEDLRFYQNGDRVTLENGTGNVAIGSTDPVGYRLYVNGTAYATGSWQGSDLRLKADLRGIDGALGKVMQLNGVSFRWRIEDYPDRGLPGGRHYGFVAQEVEEVLPDVVGSGPGGEKALAYSEIIPVLVESIKELKAGSDELRAENERLKQRVEVLEKAAGRE